jgi:A/G-specific adenine glycosylase
MNKDFTQPLLSWYRAHKRTWPWRDNPDPYAIWVSEIMAQQTRLETVLPYFERWMAELPDVTTLAQTDQQVVLNLWEGLGYYSRARNLHKAARIVVKQHAGALPADLDALKALPGIGAYTAGAIASLAFGMDAAVVDGNIKRVLARVFNIDTPIDTTTGTKVIWGLAEAYLPPGEAGDYNQGLMDLGATVCMPRTPNCPACPVQKACEAYKLGLQARLPVRTPKAETPHYTVAAAVIRRDDRFLLAQRPPDGLLGGLWEFAGGKQEAGESLHAALRREIKEELACLINVGREIGVFQHAYSHFKVTLHAFDCTLKKGEPQAVEAQALIWAKLDELDNYPMGKLDRSIAQALQQEADQPRLI